MERNVLSGHQQWDENSPESFIVDDSSSRLLRIYGTVGRRWFLYPA